MADSIDKDAKYDRQLRLWAKNGQSSLESSHVCLIHATSTGAEALKNLVLPGIGAFTIIDERIVDENDLSGNFFLTVRDIGKSISESMAANLLELNPDVQAFSEVSSVRECLSIPGFFDKFSVVLVSDFIATKDLNDLKLRLWSDNIALVHILTCGFYGSLQLFRWETAVIETHDPSRVYDLRIDRPWPDLQSFVDSFNFEEMDDIEHAHVPYIVIFIKGIARWQIDHQGSLPKTYEDKKIFKKLYVEAMARNLAIEANFIEASQQIHRALQVTTVPENLNHLFRSEKIEGGLNGLKNPQFWLLLKALKRFVSLHGVLPLSGALPDMASNTSNYMSLQQLYRKKAKEDLQEFSRLVDLISQESEWSGEISRDSIATFCKNTATLHYTEGSLEFFSDKLREELLQSRASSNTLAIHLGIKALHRWYEEGLKEEFDGYMNVLSCMLGVRKLENLPRSCSDTFAEIYHHRSTSYQNICSIMGGIGSQEILKIVTNQYIPLDNLIVYDGLHSMTEKWKP